MLAIANNHCIHKKTNSCIYAGLSTKTTLSNLCFIFVFFFAIYFILVHTSLTISSTLQNIHFYVYLLWHAFSSSIFMPSIIYSWKALSYFKNLLTMSTFLILRVPASFFYLESFLLSSSLESKCVLFLWRSYLLLQSCKLSQFTNNAV